jgi:hypothetical protein
VLLLATVSVQLNPAVFPYSLLVFQGPVFFSVAVAHIWGHSGCRLPHFKNI